MKLTTGEFLAACRKEKGYTQQEVADRLGVSNKTVSSWETGASSPDLSMLPRLAELYGVTCDEIVRGERAKTPTEPPRREPDDEPPIDPARHRNAASIGTWSSVALSAAAIVITLLIGCAALESLIGFFVGCLFLICAVLDVVIVEKLLAPLKSRLPEEYDAAKVIRRMRGIALYAAAAAFGFIFPHIFVPVHMGWTVGAAFLYGAIGAVCALALAALIGYIVRAAKKSYRTDRRKFVWTLKNGVIPYCIIGILCAAAIAVCAALPAIAPQPMVSTHTYSADSYAQLVNSLRGYEGPFSEYEYTLHETTEQPSTISEEELYGPITRDDLWTDYAYTPDGASYFFTDFPAEYAESYRIEYADGGVYVKVGVLTIALKSGDILSFPVFHPDCQGGLAALSYNSPNMTEDVHEIRAEFFPPLYETAEAEHTANLHFALFVASVVVSVLLLGGYTIFYVRRRKKFLRPQETE